MLSKTQYILSTRINKTGNSALIYIPLFLQKQNALRNKIVPFQKKREGAKTAAITSKKQKF